MLREWIASKEVRDVRAAEWEGYKQLAKRLPDHHVLSVQLIRTRTNETAAVFTVVRRGEPVQSVLMGDARGRAYPNQYQPPRADDGCDPKNPGQPRVEALVAPTPDSGTGDSSDGFGAVSPDVALGQPPIKQPITPGLVALGTTLLSATFDLGETVESSSNA